MFILSQQGVCQIDFLQSIPIFQIILLCLNLGFPKNSSLVYFFFVFLFYTNLEFMFLKA